MRSQKEIDAPRMDTSPEVHCRQVRAKNREINASHLRTFDFGCVAGAKPALQVAEKTPKVSFRGRSLPEESAFFLALAKKQIPRFARDDNQLLFSAACFAAALTIRTQHGNQRASPK
jgi:hypothetical protein